MMSIYTTEGLSLFISNTAFLEYLNVEDTIICMVMFNFNVTAFSISLEFILHLYSLFITNASLDKPKYVVRGIIYH